GPARALPWRGTSLRVWDGGDPTGPAVLLVHGFSDEGSTWAGVAWGLRRGHRVIVPDLPGHGRSGPDTPPLDYEALVDALVEVIDRLAPHTALTVVGNSLGGGLALRLGLDRPDRIRRIVAVNSAGLRNELPRELLLPRTRAGARAKLHAAI